MGACAYRFACNRALDDVLATLNQSGPWSWEGSESHWYGDYLSCRPSSPVRIRVHETDPPVSDWHQYTAQLEIETDSDILRSAIDEVFTGLLRTLEARDVPEIEPYD